MLAAAVALAFAVAPLGCFPNPDDLRQTGAGSSPECVSFASSWCAKLDACEPVVGPYSFGDEATCRQRMGAYCTSILTAESDTGWTAATLASCAAGWSGLSCADWINDPSQFPGAACHIAGHRASGAACSRDLQCETRHCGYASDTDSCGTCGPFGAQGQSCFTSLDCATGLGCADSGACAPWGAVGDACGSTRPCLNALQCRSGVCATRGSPGAACSADLECDLGQGVLCNYTTGMCGAAIAANMCDSEQSDGKVRYCTKQGQCNDDGTCTSAAADGQGCSSTGAQCVYPAFCSSSGLCTLPSTRACGTGTADGGATTNDPGGAAVANSTCANLQLCAPRRLTAVFGSQAVCQSRLKLAFDAELLLPDLGWTQAGLAACATAQVAQACDDFNDGKVPTACNVAGRRANGQPCRSSDQCASTRCVGTAGTCGQCAARAAAGAACASDSDCLPPFVCAVTAGTTTGLCVTPIESGLPCNPASTPCRRSLSCRAGTCQTPAKTGACADIEDCDERHGYLCNATTRICALATGGDTCNLSAADGSVQYCSAGGYCAANGPCVAAAADARACSPSGAQCVYPATCTGGICVLPSGADCP